MNNAEYGQNTISLLSIVIPAHNEEGCICSTVEHLHVELRIHNIRHEIVVVDDGSTDNTWELLVALQRRIPEVVPIKNISPYGFGRAVIKGLDNMNGDAVVIMMADESDDCRDVVLYWRELNEGFDCIFGSRFMKGGGTIDYPKVKYVINRLANPFLRFMFRTGYYDTTNAFKAYRKEVIDGCRPLISPHFNLTVELPLKAIVRGFTWKVVPITWRNRRTGLANLKISEMGSRYLFICLYVWLEKYLSWGDYKKASLSTFSPVVENQLNTDRPMPSPRISRDREIRSNPVVSNEQPEIHRQTRKGFAG